MTKGKGIYLDLKVGDRVIIKEPSLSYKTGTEVVISEMGFNCIRSKTPTTKKRVSPMPIRGYSISLSRFMEKVVLPTPEEAIKNMEL